MLSSRRRVVASLILVGAVLSLAACAPEGERRAADVAQRIIEEISEDLSPDYPLPHDADVLAAQALGDPHSSGVSVNALSWEGNSGDPEGARIVLRIDVSVPESNSNWWFDGGGHHEAGRAVRCWELTVYGFRNYDTLERREIGCPEGPVPPPPNPEPRVFPDGADSLLVAALTGATASDVEERFREAFPADFFSVRSATEDGELAAALGIPEELKCLVAVRGTDGVVTVYRGFPAVQLQAGETGCSPNLYFHPVTTH